MKLTHKGYKCEVHFARYFNGNNAIQLIGEPGTDYEGEVIAVASVNGEKKIPQDIVGIKTWSENAGIAQALIDGGVIDSEVLFTEPTGFVHIEYYQLTDESLSAIREVSK